MPRESMELNGKRWIISRLIPIQYMAIRNASGNKDNPDEDLQKRPVA